MTKKLFFTLLATAAFASCNKFDLNYDQTALENKDTEAINENAATVFGDIDPEQDWNSIKSGSVSITADALLKDIAKVQILTESPYYNSDAKILAEAEVAKGQTITLAYDAPNAYDQLIAACIDKDGHYYIKAFGTDQSSLSFNTASTRSRRAAGNGGYPDPSLIKVEYSRSVLSYNTERTINGEGAWRNSGWSDRIWKVSKAGNIGNGWNIDTSNYDDAVPYREIDDITDDEKKELEAIFSDFMSRKDANNRKISDNIEKIRNSKQVQLYGNHLISDGKTPITLIPVMMPSTEIGESDIYYYYYSDDEIPDGMSEAAYIKTLPKFRTIKCSHARNNARKFVNVETDFFKNFEYLLPYYGNQQFTAHIQVSTVAQADPTIYRIRNEEPQNDEVYYMTYTGSTPQLATKYEDNDANIANQLWQKFTMTDGRIMLYNIGTKKFMKWAGNTELTDNYDEQPLTFIYEDTYLYTSNKKKVLKLNWNNGKPLVSPDTNTKNSVRHWYFDEFTGSGVQAVTDVEMTNIPAEIVAQSNIIPAGYKVGLMLRKNKNDNQKGCVYSYGPLNVEISSLPDGLGNYVSKYGMADDDTRTCMFNANGKTYVTFEDGADCNFSDIIIELGGYDRDVLEQAPVNTEDKGTGVETEMMYDDMEEISGQAYTMCFEDRPMQADYDLNDVVLRCIRISKNVLQMTLVATGGNDDLVIHGAEGWRYNDTEVHEAFYATEPVNGNRFVNTVKGGTHRDVLSDFVIVPETTTIPMYLKNIYLENKTTGKMIKVSKKGEAPFAIIVPEEFDYPQEFTPITGAYADFLKWAQDVNTSNNWYKFEEADKIFPSLFKKW
ncbi:MAG: DUF4842 domain-containing protein [Prevotella sp.]|nr:DUF4842 domain-containing protein [Prevotella sp.]